MSALTLVRPTSALSHVRALHGETPRRRPVEVNRAQTATLSLKVESRDVPNVRRALARSGAPDACILDCRGVPNSTCSRLRVACDRRWTGVVMRCVMQSVGAAEFGRCEALRA
jgi:hypothetical protein